MRPPMASDTVVEARKRIMYVKKHAPYNSGEERTVSESIARRLCVLGVAVPSRKRDHIVKQDNTGELIKTEDNLGGWSLDQSEKAQAQLLERAKKEMAGDFAKEVSMEELARTDEERRAMATNEKKAEANKDQNTLDENKKKPFLRGTRG